MLRAGSTRPKTVRSSRSRNRSSVFQLMSKRKKPTTTKNSGTQLHTRHKNTRKHTKIPGFVQNLHGRVQQLVLERTGFSRASAAQFTPASIKGLRPPVDGCYLVWQLAQECFQAYYPIPLALRKPEGRRTKRSKKSRSSVPTHWSRTRKYGQVRSKTRSQQTALTMVVHFLWKCFADHGDGDLLSYPCMALRQQTYNY